MNLFGPHIHKPGCGLDLLKTWQAPGCVLMDVDGAFIAEVRERCDTKIAYRKYEGQGFNFLSTNPEWWAEHIMAPLAGNPPDLVYTVNEPFGHDSAELFEPFDEWQVRVGRRLRQLGTEPLVCCFGTGNFTGGDDRVKLPDAFPRTCEEFDWFGPHDYSWPTLAAGWGWYAGRWFKWYEDIKEATGKRVKFFIGECGITQAVIAGRGDVGWRSPSPEGVTEDSYVATLKEYLRRVVEWDAGRGIVAALCIFDFYENGGFASFEHIGVGNVVPRIMALDVPINGGDTMDDPKVIDFDYQERDFEYAKSKYGVAFRRAEVAPGQKVYRLVELWEKTGNTALIAKVLDEDGNPLENVEVTFYWPDAPEFPYPSEHDWHSNFTVGLTNANGDGSGGSMGPGAYHGESEGGPHAVWVHDPDIPSDICEKLGMLAGTFHDHLDQKFKLMVHEGEGPSVDDYKELGRNFAEAPANGIHIVAQDRNFHGTKARIGVQHVVIDGEEVESGWQAGPFDPTSLTRYEFDATYTLLEGETSRLYWVTIIPRDGGPYVGGPYLCEFETGKKGVWTIEVGEVEEPPPPPPPPPAWTMTVERKPSPGLRLLVGIGLSDGTVVTVRAPWGHSVEITAGSKPEWGAGGLELVLWHPADYTLSFLGEEFTVTVGHGETVICRFEEGEPPEPQARVVSPWVDEDDAEELLGELQESDDFSDIDWEVESE